MDCTSAAASAPPESAGIDFLAGQDITSRGATFRSITKASTRTLPLPPSLIPVLKAHLERQQAKYPHNEYLFASTTGTPINPRNLLRQFNAF
jgi:integrase